MKRWLFAYEVVAGQPERLEDLLRRDLVDLLHRATGTEPQPPAVDGSFPLRLVGAVAGASIGKVVRMRTGVASGGRDRLRIPLSWHAEPGRHLAPTFTGSVELEPLSPRRAQLTLVGSYNPPLGPLGEVADAAFLGAAARHTAEWLVEHLAIELARAARTAGTPEAAGPTEAAEPGAPLRVRDLATPDPLVLDEDLPLRTAALLLFHYGVAGAPVVSVDGALLGVLSERDLLEKEATPRQGWGPEQVRSRWRREALTVGEACTRPALVTHPGASVRDAARAMLDHDVGRLVVVDESRVAGIVSRHDVLQALLRSDSELRRVIAEVLAELGEPGVRHEVAWGEVRLEGTVTGREVRDAVVRRVRAVDGVLDVDAQDLGFDVDEIPSLAGRRPQRPERGAP